MTCSDYLHDMLFISPALLQVFASQWNNSLKPQRSPSHRNYLSYDNYPLTTLPPFAVGNLYILSSDLVQYIVSNLHVLRPVGNLEDVTIAVWMMSLQVLSHDIYMYAISNME